MCEHQPSECGPQIRHQPDCGCHRQTRTTIEEEIRPFGNDRGRGMCRRHHMSAGCGPWIRHQPDCTCHHLAMMTIDDEIQFLEKHKKSLQEKIERIEKRIAVLKPAKES